MKKKLLIFCFSLLACFARSNAYYSLGSPKGYVNDYAQILSADQVSTLETKLSNFDKETSNQIAVVIIKSLQDDTIENFAVKLFEEWKIGQAKKDNGVLLLVAIDDRKVRIEVGYGLEGALTDLQSSWIINDEITPNFKKGDYFTGLNSATDKIILATKGEYTNESSSSSNDTAVSIIGTFLVFGWFIFKFLEGLLGSTKSWWLGGALGGVGSLIYGISNGFWPGFTAFMILVPLGLIVDYILSKIYKPEPRTKSSSSGGSSFFSSGHSGGFSGGGSFGGFGGGRSGGGGSSGGW